VPKTLDTSLINALACLDFSEGEARALLCLLGRPDPVPLSAVSRGAELPRSTAHSALRALAKRGLIFCEGRYPARFAAAPVTRLESLAATRVAHAKRALAAAKLVAQFAGPQKG
jgi:sugar-specific transcriptional regulator TrmB